MMSTPQSIPVVDEALMDAAVTAAVTSRTLGVSHPLRQQFVAGLYDAVSSGISEEQKANILASNGFLDESFAIVNEMGTYKDVDLNSIVGEVLDVPEGFDIATAQQNLARSLESRNLFHLYDKSVVSGLNAIAKAASNGVYSTCDPSTVNLLKLYNDNIKGIPNIGTAFKSKPDYSTLARWMNKANPLTPIFLVCCKELACLVDKDYRVRPLVQDPDSLVTMVVVYAIYKQYKTKQNPDDLVDDLVKLFMLHDSHATALKNAFKVDGKVTSGPQVAVSQTITENHGLAFSSSGGNSGNFGGDGAQLTTSGDIVNNYFASHPTKAALPSPVPHNRGSDVSLGACTKLEQDPRPVELAVSRTEPAVPSDKVPARALFPVGSAVLHDENPRPVEAPFPVEPTVLRDEIPRPVNSAVSRNKPAVPPPVQPQRPRPDEPERPVESERPVEPDPHPVDSRPGGPWTAHDVGEDITFWESQDHYIIDKWIDDIWVPYDTPDRENNHAVKRCFFRMYEDETGRKLMTFEYGSPSNVGQLAKFCFDSCLIVPQHNRVCLAGRAVAATALNLEQRAQTQNLTIKVCGQQEDLALFINRFEAFKLFDAPPPEQLLNDAFGRH